VPQPNAFEVEMAIENLKNTNRQVFYKIPPELIKTGGRKFRLVSILIISICNKELPEEWKESIILPIYKKGDKKDCSNYRGIPLVITTYQILSSTLQSRLTP
jgi:hypothetical protein